MPLTVQDIARVCKCPLAAVDSNWPRILFALEERGLRSDLSEVAAAATIAVESAHTFRPINEMGGKDPVAYFTKLYENRHDLGNCRPGDGARFHGRGYPQLTGRGNYRAGTPVVGVDLEEHPEKANDPDISAKLFAWFFGLKRIQEAAATHQWRTVRRRWNGGYNSWDEFNRCVCGLLEVLGV